MMDSATDNWGGYFNKDSQQRDYSSQFRGDTGVYLNWYIGTDVFINKAKFAGS